MSDESDHSGAAHHIVPRHQRTQPLCRSCGSTEIVKDALAEWNFDDQKWTLLNVFEEVACTDCGFETFNCDWRKVN
jgi:predicted RNA-binding Zn-ribbon protein involved in translation (DUF1610 family)